MDEQYKIQLGVEVDVDDIQSQINKADVKPVQIKVEIENLNEIKQQLQNLGGTKGNKKVAIPIDTASVESALHEVSSAIKEIKTSIGTLDSKSGMKSLLSSINQISNALENASNQFESLNANLNALSGKDLSLNFGINLGGSNSVARQGVYGSKVRNETLPQLKQQVSDLVKYYNSTYKESLNEFEALQRMVSGTKLNNGDFFEGFLYGKDSVASRMGNGSLSSQMQAYKAYIDMFKQAASLKGLDLTSVTSGFSKSADELIKDAQDIQTGAKEMDESFEKLKQIFGGSGIDAEGLGKVLEPIITDLREIKEALQGLSSGVSIEGLTQSFDKLSDTIERLVQNATQVKNAFGDGLNTTVSDSGTEKAIQDQKELAQTLRETANEAKNLDNVSINISDGNIDDLRSALKNLKVDDASIENAAKELNELNIVAKNVSGTFKDGNLIKWNIQGVQTTTDGLERVVAITKTLGKEGWVSSEKYSQSLDKVAIAAEKVTQKLNSGTKGNSKFDVEINDVETKFNNLSNKSVDLQEKIKLLKQEFENMQTASAKGDIEGLVAANERYERILQDVNNQLKLNRQEEQTTNNKDSLMASKQNALLRLKNLFGDNSEAARKFGSEVDRLQKEINECGNLAGIKNLNQQITNLGLKVKESNVQTQTFGQRLKKQWQQYSSYLSVASLFMYAEQGLRSMFEQVKLIDSAMTELKKVTNETDESYNRFLTNAASRSKELGTTIDGLVSSTADFARLGYGFEDAQGLAEVANIYAVVGDEIEGVEGATESLISTMAAFKGEMNGMSNTDFAMSIIDKFNEIGNNFAISSGGIGEALERSASSLMAANNTIDESIALITAANTVVVLCHAA